MTPPPSRRRGAGRAARAPTNAEFVVFDAESGGLRAFAPDLVVAHLCMSSAIIERAARLAPGHALAFVALHADQWRETGRRSRFAYDEDQAAASWPRSRLRRRAPGGRARGDGVRVGRAGAGGGDRAPRTMEADGRWFRYIKFLEDGGRTLTRAHLIVKARGGDAARRSRSREARQGARARARLRSRRHRSGRARPSTARAFERWLDAGYAGAMTYLARGRAARLIRRGCCRARAP